MSSLKSCPFCASFPTQEITCTSMCRPNVELLLSIVCPECGCSRRTVVSIDDSCKDSFTMITERMKSLEKVWNTRPEITEEICND